MSTTETPPMSPPGGWLRPRPTLVVPLPEPATSTLHLAEGKTGWTLTMTLTPELLDRLVRAAPGVADGLSCTVHVEPNLLPGEPFTVEQIEIVPGPARRGRTPAAMVNGTDRVPATKG